MLFETFGQPLWETCQLLHPSSAVTPRKWQRKLRRAAHTAWTVMMKTWRRPSKVRYIFFLSYMAWDVGCVGYISAFWTVLSLQRKCAGQCVPLCGPSLYLLSASDFILQTCRLTGDWERPEWNERPAVSVAGWRGLITIFFSLLVCSRIAVTVWCAMLGAYRQRSVFK